LSLKDFTGENQLLPNNTDAEERRRYVTGSSYGINSGLQKPAAQRAVRHRGSTCTQICARVTEEEEHSSVILQSQRV